MTSTKHPLSRSVPTRQTAFDYDRTIIVFHETRRATAARLVAGAPFEGAHIQLCIRKSENILAVWSVKKDGRYGKDEA